MRAILPPVVLSRPPGSGASAREVAAVFLRLGVVAFGGPAAHTAMMREELVRRRAWVDDERFVDLVGATQLVPGPNSTELAIHLGHDRAGWRGLLVAGVCFIVPAALLVGVLAWAYVEHGDTSVVGDVFDGAVPVVLAIIAWSVVPLLRAAATSWWLAVVGLAALAAYLLGLNELVVLVGGALAALVPYVGGRAREGGTAALLLPLALAPSGDGRLGELFVTMLKIGAVLYGSGYVLITFLEGDFVERLGWLSNQQLVDAVAVGQVTPGPVFTTATFVGYLVAGFWGAVLATVAIFLPSFVFVGLLTRLVGWLRSRAWTAAVLDGLNVTALALILGVAVDLGRDNLASWWAPLLFAVTLLLLWRTRLNSGWFVLAGGAAGILTGAL
ncbi:chromate efflux transporter [Nocardioides dilutus]